MKVVYRESIKGPPKAMVVTLNNLVVVVSGVVKMRFEPSDENVFAEEVFGGAVLELLPSC